MMLKHDEFLRMLRNDQVIAAVKDEAQLESALSSKCGIVFVLFGDLITIDHIVAKIKNAGKFVFVHIDLIDGLSPRDVAVSYIEQNTLADGIISTKPNIIKRAKAHNLLTVQRFFLLDSIALNNIDKQLVDDTDAIEILPGIIPKIIGVLAKRIFKPIIAGGLISDADDVREALHAGATAISTSKATLWIR
jgi:glycerol uptake operon antiterminator